MAQQRPSVTVSFTLALSLFLALFLCKCAHVIGVCVCKCMTAFVCDLVFVTGVRACERVSDTLVRGRPPLISSKVRDVCTLRFASPPQSSNTAQGHALYVRTDRPRCFVLAVPVPGSRVCVTSSAVLSRHSRKRSLLYPSARELRMFWTDGRATMEAIAKHDFKATAPDELSFKKGSLLRVSLRRHRHCNDPTVVRSIGSINGTAEPNLHLPLRRSIDDPQSS